MGARVEIYIELVRPFTLLAPFIGFLSGAMVSAAALPGLPAFIGAISAALLNGASNVINQYFDLEIDRINKPGRPLPAGRISGRKAFVLSLSLYAVSLFLASTVNARLLVLVAVAAALTFFYSAPPLRLKRLLFVSNLAIAVARGMLLIVAGWSVYRPVWHTEPWFIGIIFALYLFGAATTKDFSDIEGDARYGIRTLPVVFGAEKAARMIAPFFSVPFLLVPVGISLAAIKAGTWPLTLLSLWGLYTAASIRKQPLRLTIEKNHVSWLHMYFTLLAGQIGFAIAYLLF